MRILSIELSVLSLVLIFTSTIAKVMVYAPKQLKQSARAKKGDEEPFKISLANFGVIPYGHSLIGRIYYDTENADGCQQFGDFDFSKDPDDENNPTPIILVDRGNCTFVMKIRNIEHAGGRLGIVMDNTIEDVTNVIMSDDGTGMGITIPSLLIGKSDGDILKEFLEDHGGTHYMKINNQDRKKNRDRGDDLDDEDDEDDDDSDYRRDERREKTDDQKLVEQASLLVTFEMPHPDQRVEYDIWYSSVDNKALDFIVDFEKFDEMLGSKALMTPHFVSWSCAN